MSAVERTEPMPEPLALARPTDRLFFAIFPDAHTAALVAQLAQRLRGVQGLNGKPHAAQRLHITLHHLGDHAGLPTGVVAAATEAAATVEMPPFEISFDHAASFSGRPNSLPFVLRGGDGLAELAQFQQVLGIALKKAGLGRWVKAQYTPHLTLLYDDRCVAAQAVEPIGWTATEFVLVDSLLGQTRHVLLARWPLRG